MSSRCCVCKKKLGLLPFKCKCEKDFCSAHRAPEDHECTHDFKKEGKELLQKLNPACSAAKLENKI